IPHHVPVAFLRIKLQGKAANVTLGVGRTTLASHGSETSKHFSLLADALEDLGPCVLCDVMCDRKSTKGARALSVHTTLRDDLPHKVAKLFMQPNILRQKRPPWTRGQAILVIRHRRAKVGRQRGLVGGIGRLPHRDSIEKKLTGRTLQENCSAR